MSNYNRTTQLNSNTVKSEKTSDKKSFQISFLAGKRRLEKKRKVFFGTNFEDLRPDQCGGVGGGGPKAG
jgi:hypothetical protein